MRYFFRQGALGRLLFAAALLSSIFGAWAGCATRRVDTTMPPSPPPAPAGTLVDSKHLGDVRVPGHLGSTASIYQFSYVTISDDAQVATARLAIPKADATGEIVAHLHGTVGFADHCAPSAWPGFGFESPLNPLAADMVASGRVVVMPDYPGLGTPGRHRYVEREATGRSVWDSVAAATALLESVAPAAEPSNRVLLMGHSQGGHAVLSALSTLRPDDGLDVVGAVAFSPPGDAIHHARLVARGMARPAPLAWGLTSYANAYPEELDPERWFTERVAEGLPDLMERRCVVALNVWLGLEADGIFTEDALRAFEAGDLGAGVDAVLLHEQFSALHTDVPILIFHGTRDTVLPAELSERLAQHLATQGNTVDWRAVEHAGHLGVPRMARTDARHWIEARFVNRQTFE